MKLNLSLRNFCPKNQGTENFFGATRNISGLENFLVPNNMGQKQIQKKQFKVTKRIWGANKSFGSKNLKLI